MAISDKRDFPPLLPPGLHEMSAEDLRTMCVMGFPHSSTRERIMAGLEAVIAALSEVGIGLDIWVDGSFVTHKLNPADVDVVLCLRSDTADQCDDRQRGILRLLTDPASKQIVKNEYLCDSYAFVEYPDDHPLHSHGVSWREYWLRQFGLSRVNEAKGMAVIRV